MPTKLLHLLPSTQASEESQLAAAGLEQRIQEANRIEDAAHHEQREQHARPHAAAEGKYEGLPGAVCRGFGSQEGKTLDAVWQAQLDQGQVALEEMQISNGKACAMAGLREREKGMRSHSGVSLDLTTTSPISPVSRCVSFSCSHCTELASLAFSV